MFVFPLEGKKKIRALLLIDTSRGNKLFSFAVGGILIEEKKCCAFSKRDGIKRIKSSKTSVRCIRVNFEQPGI